MSGPDCLCRPRKIRNHVRIAVPGDKSMQTYLLSPHTKPDEYVIIKFSCAAAELNE